MVMFLSGCYKALNTFEFVCLAKCGGEENPRSKRFNFNKFTQILIHLYIFFNCDKEKKNAKLKCKTSS